MASHQSQEPEHHLESSHRHSQEIQSNVQKEQPINQNRESEENNPQRKEDEETNAKKKEVEENNDQKDKREETKDQKVKGEQPNNQKREQPKDRKRRSQQPKDEKRKDYIQPEQDRTQNPSEPKQRLQKEEIPQVKKKEKKRQKVKKSFVKINLQQDTKKQFPQQGITCSQNNKASSNPLNKSNSKMKKKAELKGQLNKNYLQQNGQGQKDNTSLKKLIIQDHQSHQSSNNATMITTTKTIKTMISITSKYNYKQNLIAVFDHYCKMSYALGKAPTFDEIAEKAHVMTIHKFMIFCRDFSIREKVNRNTLVDLFKKNAINYQHLSFENFEQAIAEISALIFPQYNEDRQFNKMLVFLRMHNTRAYTNKMNEIGIKFREKTIKEKKQLSEYAFKLTPNNGKAAEQIALEVQQKRKQREAKKEEMMKWHRQNKQNKIDKLYQQGAETLGKKSAKLNTCKISNVESLEQRNVYNPSIIISTLKNPNKYQKLHQMRAEKPKQLYDHLGHKIKAKNANDFKVSRVIKEAKQQIKHFQMRESSLKTDRSHFQAENTFTQDISELRIKSQIRTLHNSAIQKTQSLFKTKQVTDKSRYFEDIKALVDEGCESDRILEQHFKAEQNTKQYEIK